MKIVEVFRSVQGEGPTTGCLTTFVRFAGCSLQCPECDTPYSWKGVNRVGESKDVDPANLLMLCVDLDPCCQYLCITGGEPLEQNHQELAQFCNLAFQRFAPTLKKIVVETAGHVSVDRFLKAVATKANLRYLKGKFQFVIDYKLPSTGKRDRMLISNFERPDEDCIKFVCKHGDDFSCAIQFLRELASKNLRKIVYFNPLGGQPSRWLSDLIMRTDFSWAAKHFDVRIGIQLHKLLQMR